MKKKKIARSPSRALPFSSFFVIAAPPADLARKAGPLPRGGFVHWSIMYWQITQVNSPPQKPCSSSAHTGERHCRLAMIIFWKTWAEAIIELPAGRKSKRAPPQCEGSPPLQVAWEIPRSQLVTPPLHNAPHALRPMSSLLRIERPSFCNKGACKYLF